MKAPHIVRSGGWGAKQHPKPGRHHQPPPKPPPPHKKPAKPKPAKKPKPARKPRRLSPGSDVACCTAEALGLLLGWGADEVLALYWRTASDPDAGATILDTLEAAGSFVRGWAMPHLAPTGQFPSGSGRRASHSLILGVTLPEPHAIAVTPDGTWWSWGQPFNPAAWPELVVEEAWCLP